MPRIAIFFGIVLILLGVLGYFQQPAKSPAKNSEAVANPDSTDSKSEKDAKTAENLKNAKGRSLTAFIPSAFGALIGACGVFGLNPNLRKHTMHLAAMFASLGTLAGLGKTGMDVMKIVRGEPYNATSLTFVILMALLCGVFVFLCVQSFRETRRRREMENEESAATT